MKRPRKYTCDWGVPCALRQPCVVLARGSRRRRRRKRAYGGSDVTADIGRDPVYGAWSALCMACRLPASQEHLKSDAHEIAARTHTGLPGVFTEQEADPERLADADVDQDGMSS